MSKKYRLVRIPEKHWKDLKKKKMIIEKKSLKVVSIGELIAEALENEKKGKKWLW